MSIHDEIMQDAAACLVDVMGDRHDAKYWQTPDAEPVALSQWIVGPITNRQEIAEQTGIVLRVETRQIIGLSAELKQQGIKRISPKATVELHGEKWNIDTDETRIDTTLTVIGLRRDPIINFQEMRNANI